MKTLEILVGIPCSGKSTYAQKEYLNLSKQCNEIISRDKIRLDYFGKNYKQNKFDEKVITKIYDKKMESLFISKGVCKIILDNTHCKEKYINEIIRLYGNTCKIEIKFFDINLYLAHYRNILRYFKTGKWIPISVINKMWYNYNKINKEKYAKYMV